MAKKRKKNNYFTKVHENAIIEYAKSEDRNVKEELYVTLIQPAFDELVEKIVYTYKFNSLPNIDYLKQDCKNWLITILNKYDPERKSKAFSYFSVVTKNWFIAKSKKNKKAVTREISYEDLLKESADYPLDQVAHNDYFDRRSKHEFMQNLMSRIQDWSDEAEREREKKVLDAITILIESIDEIDILNKKAIYLYMREITGLNTKQIVSALSRPRAKYKEFKSDWNDGEI